MRKIIYLLFLCVGIIGCSTEPLDSNEELFTADSKAKVSNEGNNKEQASFDIPTLTLKEATQTTLEITVTAGATGALGGFDIHWTTEAHLDLEGWKSDICEKGFASNNNNNYGLSEGEEFPLPLEDLAEECGIVLECGTTYVFRVRAKTEGDGLKKSGWSETYKFSTAPCEEPECEGALMYGNHEWNTQDTGNNWGWSHLFNAEEDGSVQTLPLYSGAAQNDLDKGEKVGEVTVTLKEDGSVSFSHEENINITHLYVSDDEPTETAPGQFNQVGNKGDENLDGKFWIMLKAEVCQ